MKITLFLIKVKLKIKCLDKNSQRKYKVAVWMSKKAQRMGENI